MDKNEWLFANTPTLSVLKLRPLALSVLEAKGMNPWKLPRAPISDLCRHHGIAWNTFAAELRAMRTPEKNTDWSGLPVYYLLDFLVGEHGEFVSEYLPAVRFGLDAKVEGRHALTLELARQWPEFVSALTTHQLDEEEVLFPNILLQSAALPSGIADSDILPADAVNSEKLLRNEKRFAEDLDRFQHTLHWAKAEAPQLGILPLLTDFHERLRRHARLESEVLFPLAAAAEKRRQDSNGSPAVAAASHR